MEDFIIKQNVFAKRIYISNVRHLQDISIDIDTTTKKHLIITGKNGSGKTSLLNSLSGSLSSRLYDSNDDNIEKLNTLAPEGFASFEMAADVVAPALYKSGNFIIAYFKAKRKLVTLTPKGISKISLKKTYSIDEYIADNFLQHLVNLKAEASFAQSEGDKASTLNIENWFNNFEKSLRLLFDDESLELVFDRKEYNFYFKLSNGNTPDINQLSDGYSAILNIVAEIILRMEKTSPMIHEMQGVVL